MKKKWKIYFSEYLKNELEPGLSKEIATRLEKDRKDSQACDSIHEMEQLALSLKKDVVEPSPLLLSRIQASVSGLERSDSPRLLLRWIPIALSSVAILLLLFFFPWQGGSASQSTLEIDYASLEEYVLANPDIVLAFIETPSEKNAYTLYEGLYEYVHENGLDMSIEEVYENYSFLASNAEHFI